MCAMALTRPLSDQWLTQVVFFIPDRQTARSLDLSRYSRRPNH
jgi:hypothetical protein